MIGFLLDGKRKMSFPLSSQINDLQSTSLIWAPHTGRFDDFLPSHHSWFPITTPERLQED
jgi:hypothetical protein